MEEHEIFLLNWTWNWVLFVVDGQGDGHEVMFCM